MKSATFAQFIFRELDKIKDNDSLDRVGKIRALRNLLLRLIELATDADKLHFSTIYARIAYLTHQINFPGQLVFQLHRFRRGLLTNLTANELEKRVLTGYKIVLDLAAAVFDEPLPEAWHQIAQAAYPLAYRAPTVVDFYPQLRVIGLEFDTENNTLIVREEQNAAKQWHLEYGLENENELVQTAINIIQRVTGLPVVLNLLQATAHQDQKLVPRQIVVEPDYLIDVTAVAYTYDGKGSTQPWGNLSRKLLPYEARPALLKGNIVNLFLDVLINEPTADFNSLARLIFQTQPLALCGLSDAEVKKLVVELRDHYRVLKHIAIRGLAEVDIQREDCLLEPSFYSPFYGLQGRLDLLHRQMDDQSNKTSIIELKSGKIFAPNRHGLNQGHFIQTLLYDLMVNAAIGQEANVAAYILYSITTDRPLRYAPPERFQQAEAISVRNQLLAIEYLLCRLGQGASIDLLEQTDRLFAKLNPKHHQRLSPFTKQDFVRVRTAYHQLSELERRYLGAFLGFTAREQRLAKTGRQGSEKLNGLAGLWLDEPSDKSEAFEIITGLELDQYAAQTGIIRFHRPKDTDQLAKFRTGDVVILYATAAPQPAKGEALGGQVFKATIIALTPQQISLRLRSKQLNDRSFRKLKPYWCIEKDVLDSSFSNHYRGLWAWAESAPELRQRWLGLTPPTKPQSTPTPLLAAGLTEEQQLILGKILAAPDYFLLWGPPGTGKTSVMLRHLVGHLLQETSENILILAYTNRAVDEICESIEKVTEHPFKDYLRIGSRYGTAPSFQQQLLSVRSEQYDSRAGLIQLLGETRIFVGTVAGVGGKEDLFKLKQFDRIIIDEASQILEPLLLGLLCRIPKAVLIGDHRQLPAVVQQDEESSRVYDSELVEAIKLEQLGTSLFERLYLRANEAEWSWAFDQLKYQGRMHQEIMNFPAQAFYGGNYYILPDEIPYRAVQLASLQCSTPQDELQQQLIKHRLTYFPTPVDHSSIDYKTNIHEAQLLLQVIQAFEALYQHTDQPIQIGEIGIITPYRAQIANIRQVLYAAGLEPDHYTVDTVERYQGGARRIILLSFCTNDQRQMRSLAQTNAEKIDRKLNVAMTRAREHLVLIGCEAILRSVPHYDALLDFIKLPE